MTVPTRLHKGEMYAHDMIGNFKNGVSAFFDWNLLLDSQGGPNHVGNFCDAPSDVYGRFFSKVEKHLSYYYIGHFSRYVTARCQRCMQFPYPPGAVRQSAQALSILTVKRC